MNEAGERRKESYSFFSLEGGSSMVIVMQTGYGS